MSLTISMNVVTLDQKPIEKERLDEIIQEHLKWRKDESCGKCADLRNVDLRGSDLSGLDLAHADFTGANLMNARLCKTNLSSACLIRALLAGADLSNAVMDEAEMIYADLTHADLTGASMQRTDLTGALMWNCSLKNAVLTEAALYTAKLCDCDFTSADLKGTDLSYTDLDHACFTGADLKNACFVCADNSYWADLKKADLTGADLFGCALEDESVEGAVGLNIITRCPDEGSFIAWKKCCHDRIVKLLIPETAERTGGSRYSCRASEAVVLNICDDEHDDLEEAESLQDRKFVYRLGETVVPEEEFDDSPLHDGSGIHFFLTRAEAEQYE